MGATHELFVGLPAEMVTSCFSGPLVVDDGEIELVEPPHMVGWVGDLVLIRHQLRWRRSRATHHLIVDVGAAGARRCVLRVTLPSGRVPMTELVSLAEDLRRAVTSEPRSTVVSPARVPAPTVAAAWVPAG